MRASCKQVTPTTPVMKRRANLQSQRGNNLGVSASGHCLCKIPCVAYHHSVSQVRSCGSRSFLRSRPSPTSAMTILFYCNIRDDSKLLPHHMSEITLKYYISLTFVMTINYSSHGYLRNDLKLLFFLNASEAILHYYSAATSAMMLYFTDAFFLRVFPRSLFAINTTFFYSIMAFYVRNAGSYNLQPSPWRVLD